MNYSTAIVQLPLVREMETWTLVRTPEDTARICHDMRDLAQETFQVLTVSAKNTILNRVMVGLGILDGCMVHPREVFRNAILENAAGLVLIHNHPSGDPEPSSDDTRVTKNLIDAGRIIGIKVLDHVIIGRPQNGSKGYFSFRASGLCSFDS